MCGIFGMLAPKPVTFDKRGFCVLGVNNDSRGGDSCGIFIDKKYEYGVNENKLFLNFFPKSKLLKKTTKCQIALGHCRKASVGAINEANAQPVIIKNNKDEVDFVLIHNGTIVNYKELATKWIPDIDIKDMTDSQVMAHIFYHKGYDVLGEYIGAGAFVIVDYRNENPKIYFFKGESKAAEYSKVTTIERPLFCTYNNKEFIFSSISEYLAAIRPEREVFTIVPNTLIEYKEGHLHSLVKYDRKELYQTNTTSNVVTYKPNYYSNNYYNNYWNKCIDVDTKGVYWDGTNKAHGLYNVDRIGNIEEGYYKNTTSVAFWKGVLLKNVSCYDFLKDMAKKCNFSPDELLGYFPDLVHYLGACPCWLDYSGHFVISDTPTSNYKYTGTMKLPFTTETLYIKGGILDDFTENTPYRDTFKTVLESLNYKIDRDALSKLFN